MADVYLAGYVKAWLTPSSHMTAFFSLEMPVTFIRRPRPRE